MKYFRNFGLTVHFVVEGNGKAVCTNTCEAWNIDESSCDRVKNDIVTYCSYKSKLSCMCRSKSAAIIFYQEL